MSTKMQTMAIPGTLMSIQANLFSNGTTKNIEDIEQSLFGKDDALEADVFLEKLISNGLIQQEEADDFSPSTASCDVTIVLYENSSIFFFLNRELRIPEGAIIIKT